MKIYMVCHSNDVAPGTPEYENVSPRPLTEKGRTKMQKIASARKTLGVEPDLIVSSPYVRARQTAEILSKGLKYKKELSFSDCLVPMSDADAIIGEINEKYAVGELLLVGHEPSLSGLIGSLVAQNQEISITLKNGGICCVSADDLRVERRAVLEWLLTPKILSALS